MRVAYLLSEFPGLTHIIFWRELVRLRELGDDVLIAATRKPKYRSPHAFADEPCQYLWPPRGGAIAAIAAPHHLAAQLAFIAGLPDGGATEKARVAALLPSSWTLARWLRRERIEHLHVHSFADAAYVAALAHLLTGVPFSVTLHGGIENYGLNHAAKLARAAFACATSAATHADIDRVAPGKCIAEDVPCGVDMTRFHFVERVPGDTLRLISVGRLNQGKGVRFALRALASIRGRVDVHYTLVGSGPGEADLRAEVKALGLDDLVTFAGPAGEEEVARFLHAHDVAILTSFGSFETTAIAVREAMATGMPVIMSRVGEAERMITPGRDGLIVPQQDADAVADAIVWFATHRDRIPAMGRAAHERACAEFADTVGARRLHRAIHAAARRPPH